MGIGAHAIRLTRILAEAGAFPPGARVMELGSQDFAPDLASAHASIAREFGFSGVEDIKLPRDLYRRMGCSVYECIDLDGHHNARTFDLNEDLRTKYKFDATFNVVTNHGTTEHLFNQLQAFRNIHDMTAVEGVMLHALPFQGYQNHGLFNYQPSMFLDLAVANDYEMLGVFLSVNDDLFDYDEEFLQRNAVLSVEDVLVMAALRKRKDEGFKPPYDGRYFAVNGRGGIEPLGQVGSTRRFGSLTVDRGPAGSSDLVLHQEPVTPFRIITPIWGRDYAQAFVDMSLPSQLGVGNLGAFGPGQATYTIVTTASEMRLIRSSPAFVRLSEMMNTEFVLHVALPGESSYERMTRCYNLALERVRGPQTCLFLTADDFYADGLFRTVIQQIATGKKVVLVPTLRVILESFRLDLRSRDLAHARPRDLVPLLLAHEHPMTTSCVVNCATGLIHELPAETLVRREDGYLGRWNVMHPLAIRLEPPFAMIRSTIDWDFPVGQVLDVDDIFIIRDSDLGFVVSATPRGYSQEYPLGYVATTQQRIDNLIRWLNIGWALNYHILQFSQPVYVHAADLDETWADMVAELDRVCGPFSRYIEAHQTRRVPLHMRRGQEWLRACAIEKINWPMEARRRLAAGLRRTRKNLLVRTIRYGRRKVDGLRRRLGV